MRRTSFLSALAGLLLALFAAIAVIPGATVPNVVGSGSLTDPTPEEITDDVGVFVRGYWRRTGEGSATVDLSGQTNLTLASGTFHTNGDLKVQNPSTLASDGIVSVNRNTTCTNPNDPLCVPDHLSDAGGLPDPLADRAGQPSVGGTQNFGNCNGECSLTEGRYRGPFNINSNDTVLLAPGYYVFEQGNMNLNGTIAVDPDAPDHPEAGRGVMLFFRPGAQLEVGSQGSLQFTPPEAGPYEDIAIYYHRSNQATIGWRASNNDMPGWVYGKNAHLRLNNDTAWTANNRFNVRTMNSQGVDATVDPGGWDGWAGEVEPPFEPEPDVAPIFECYIEEQDGTYTAYFGYENNTVGEDGSLIPIEIALGTDNSLTPASFDGSQPIAFGLPGVVDGRPGRTAFEDAEPNAFVITGWDGSDIVWTLNGSTATASLASNCSSQPELRPLCFGVPATIEGDDENNILVGTDGDDVIVAGGGADVVDGLGGNDLICGNGGLDVLNGDDGNDRIDGGDNSDVLDGGVGDDEVLGGGADDVLLGGPGTDQLSGGAGDDALRGGDGDDQITDNDPSETDRDAADGGEGADICDVDLDDTKEAC